MHRKKSQAIEWLEFEKLTQFPRLAQGVFLRRGGVSEGPFATLKVGGSLGDDPRNVEENRRRILLALSLPCYVAGKQVHGNEVAIVKEPGQEVGDCDGLITNRPGIALLIKHADCQAAILYDPVRHVVANVHAGWRGNVQNIYRTAVLKMEEAFGCRPEDLWVGISPSLGPEHAEFKNYKTEFPEGFWKYQVKPTYFDLWAIARDQLEACGVLPKKIEIASLCTYTNSADFYSFRRDKPTGRHATVAMLL
jgi:YfiH family protein